MVDAAGQLGKIAEIIPIWPSDTESVGPHHNLFSGDARVGDHFCAMPLNRRSFKCSGARLGKDVVGMVGLTFANRS